VSLRLDLDPRHHRNEPTKAGIVTDKVVRCLACRSTYLIPESCVSDAFEQARAAWWFMDHDCAALALEGMS
jgi:hypothetical protein